MNFDNEKKQALHKLDKSKKGNIDKQIVHLVNLINSHKDYYTTSSCAGRIMLLKEGDSKKDTEWLFSSHETISYDELNFYNIPKETVWLRMEPPILHIACRNMEAADELMKIANDAGFRRSAILTVSKRIIVEIMIPEKLDAPVSEDNSLLVSIQYIMILIDKSNSRLKKARKRLKKFKLLFQQYSKQ